DGSTSALRYPECRRWTLDRTICSRRYFSIPMDRGGVELPGAPACQEAPARRQVMGLIVKPARACRAWITESPLSDLAALRGAAQIIRYAAVRWSAGVAPALCHLPSKGLGAAPRLLPSLVGSCSRGQQDAPHVALPSVRLPSLLIFPSGCAFTDRDSR